MCIRDSGEPCQNVIVMNNTVLHGHGGFVVGSEMSGGVNNIYVDNCTFMGTDCLLYTSQIRINMPKK